MIVIGIDPGLDGGLAALNGEELHLQVMPVVSVGTKREIDEQAVTNWLLDYPPGVSEGSATRVFIERVTPFKQGRTGAFTFGTGWGLIRGICAGMGFSYSLVRPQEWQKVALQGQPKGSEYATVSRRWPNADWRATERSRKPHSGLVDAALIALYGQKQERPTWIFCEKSDG